MSLIFHKSFLDVCSIALNRCLQRSQNVASDHLDYQIALEYEFLDDAYNEWTLDAVRLDSTEGKGRGELLTRKEIEKQLKKKNNHTLSVMVCSLQINIIILCILAYQIHFDCKILF